MALRENDIKSELSYASLHAVASRSGCECQVTGRHSDGMGVDARLHVRERFGPPATHLNRFTLEVQLKATSQPLPVVDGHCSFVLKKDQYDKLRDAGGESLLLLVVLVLPADPADWLTCSPEALTLRRCAFWVSLLGAPDTASTAGQTVYLPQANLFSVEGLRALLARVARRETITYAAPERHRPA
jgi:hypothetical protein